jgi:hypothetical protein
VNYGIAGRRIGRELADGASSLAVVSFASYHCYLLRSSPLLYISRLKNGCKLIESLG